MIIVTLLLACWIATLVLVILMYRDLRRVIPRPDKKVKVKKHAVN